MELGTTISVLSLGIAMVGHLVTSVWWASSITTRIEILIEKVNTIMETNSRHEATFATKEQVAKDFAHIETRVDAAWKKIDQISEKI